MENINITGSADISLFGETRDDLTKDKTFDGGSMTITNRAPFSVDASIYEEDEDAYTNTEGNSERLWEVRPEDEEVYLGTLTYTNDFLEPIDFGETAVGSIIDITLDTPSQGELRGNGNFFLDIDQEREGAETLEVGFRGLDPNNFQFISTDGETRGVIPYRFDFLGGRISGSGEEVDPSFTFTVEDNSTVSIDLYGRVFALDNGELPVNDEGDSGSEGNTPIDTGEDEPDAEIEDGTNSEAEDNNTDGGADDTTVDDSSDETPTPEEEDDVSSDAPVDTGTDSPDTEDGIDADDTATDEPTIQDTITALQDQIGGLQPLVDQGIISQEVLDDLESQVEELLDIANGDSGNALTPPEDIPTLPPTTDSEDNDSDSVAEIEDSTPPVVAFPTPEPVTDDNDSNDSTVESPDETPPTADSETPPAVSSGDESLLSNDFDSGSELSINSISTVQIDPLESTDVTTEVVTVSGSGIPNQEVDLTVIGVYSDALTTTTDLGGNWSIELPVPLIDGVYELIATQPTLDGSGQLNDLEKLTIDTDFDIEFDFSDSSFQDLPSGQRNEIREFIEEAEEFWEDVIIGGLPNVGEVDDLDVKVSIEDLGSVNTLADANPTDFRSDGDKLPYQANIRINKSTLDDPASAFSPLLSDDEINVLIVDTIKHEIGHALGITKSHYLTNKRNLLVGVGNLTIGIPGFIGENALGRYRDISGIETDVVPLEKEGFLLNRSPLSHWDENLLGDEIMTPKLNNRPVFLSSVTIGALDDLGYEVDYSRADNFEAKKPSIKIESPVPTLSLGDILTVNITATDESGIRKVEGFFDLDNDGNLDALDIESLGSGRYRISSTVSISGGNIIPFLSDERTLTIVAQDNFGITEIVDSSVSIS